MMKQKVLSQAVLTVVFSMVIATAAQGAVIVSESFDYGESDVDLEVGDTSILNGGNGLTGNWELFNELSNNRGSYVASGLTLGHMLVNGGAMRTEGEWAGSSTIARQLDTTLTGTIYGAFLFQSGNTVNPSLSSMQFRDTSDNTPSSDWGAEASVSLIASTGARALVGYQTGTESVILDGPNVTASTADPVTYLSLYKVTNVGGTGDKTITAWTLNEAQFDYFSQFIDNGLEAALEFASVGTGNTNVYQYGTITSSSTVTIDDTRSILLFTRQDPASGTVWPVIYDELRISDTSLDEVVTIPEPASFTLLALAAALCTRRRRR